MKNFEQIAILQTEIALLEDSMRSLLAIHPKTTKQTIDRIAMLNRMQDKLQMKKDQLIVLKYNVIDYAVYLE